MCSKLTMEKDPPEMIELSENEMLFLQYLRVFNCAIKENKNKFPYSEIWKNFISISERDLNCIIYDNRPKDSFNLKIKNGELGMSNLPTQDEENKWAITYSEMKRVVDNADEYIKNPAKLDWNWLKTAID